MPTPSVYNSGVYNFGVYNLSDDQSQEVLLQLSNINPIFLVDITSASGTLRFCSDRTIDYLGNLYFPYLSTVGTLRSAASFPENNTTNKELQLQFNNGQVELNGTVYTHLSQTFDPPIFPWELSDIQVRLLLTDGEEDTFTEDVATKWVSSGTVGSPDAIDRQKFVLPVYTRIFKLNDQIPLRPVTVDDFPEADRDELNGRTYIPIVVGSGVRTRAIATAAGATTTATEQTSAGTVLKVSETTGFTNGDSFIIGGFVNDPFTVSTVDATANEFQSISPDLSTLNSTITLGTVIRADKTFYQYAVADHVCGDISKVEVIPRGKKDPVTVSGSLFSKQTVTDAKAIGGQRTDVRITELIPFGTDEGVSVQPEFSVDGGSHNHAVDVTQISVAPSFANGTTPAGASAANNGNEDDAFTLSVGGTDTVTYDTFSAVAGVFVEQRYYMVAQGPTVTGDVRIRRGTTAFLTLSAAFGKGEFRSAVDTGGSDTTTWNVIVQTNPTQCDLFEGWKEISSNPSVSETTRDLTNTTRDTNVSVNVSAADIEVGDKIFVTIDGVPVPDSTGDFGPVSASGTAIQRPDGVARWILQEALGQTSEIINQTTITGSAGNYDTEGTQLRFALQQPTKLDKFFDQLADNSQSMWSWGRDGFSLRFLDEPSSIDTLVEDEGGVISIGWSNSISANEISNSLSAFFDRDWTQTVSREESFEGNVIVEDLTSQARFGVRKNEVIDGNKVFYFDYTATSAQADKLLTAIVLDKSSPKRIFTINTDWTHIAKEPGDFITINSPTLNSTVEARIIENTIDSRLFCRIVAKEVERGATIFGAVQTVSVDMDGGSISNQFRNLTKQSHGMGNAWTIMMRFKQNAGVASTLINILDMRGAVADPKSGILLRSDRTGGDRELDIFAWDNDGTTRKWYTVTGFFTDNKWYQIFITWDGTNLKVWNAAVGGSVAEETTVKNEDSAITMVDNTLRDLAMPSLAQAHYHEWAMWGRDLSEAEMNEIIQGGANEYNLTKNNAIYLAKDDLVHWWRFGLSSTQIGKDYSNSAVTMDLMQDQVGIDAGDIVNSHPSE